MRVIIYNVDIVDTYNNNNNNLLNNNNNTCVFYINILSTICLRYVYKAKMVFIVVLYNGF
jgi:hypothetical protein